MRLRLGDLAKAEEAFDQADDLGHDPEPGRSLLLLAREKPAAALASIRRALGDDLPPLARARLLPPSSRSRPRPTRSTTRPRRPTSSRRPPSATTRRRCTRPPVSPRIGRARPRRRRRRGSTATAGAAALAGHERALRGRANAHAARARLRGRRRRGGRDARAGAGGSVFDQLGARIDAAKVDALLGRDAGRRDDDVRLHRHRRLDRHLEHHGDANWQKLLRRHDELVRRVANGEGGAVVDHTGDGFFLAFPTADRAVAAAIAIQREAAGDLPFELRIGVHTAEATSLGENYRGKGVHVAARIGALGRGEEIVASRETVAALNGVRLERAEERAAERDLGAGRRRLGRLARRQ